MKTPFISRKNLIALAITVLYVCLFIVLGFLLTGDQQAVNPILDIAYAMGFEMFEITDTQELVAIVITGLFIFVLVFGIIFIHRLGKFNGRKFWSTKVALPIAIYAVGTVLVAIFINLVLELFDFSYLGDMLYLYFVDLLLTTLGAIVLAIPLGALIVIIVNFVNMGKPYAFFSNEQMPDFGDSDEDTIVSNSFGEIEKKEEPSDKAK